MQKIISTGEYLASRCSKNNKPQLLLGPLAAGNQLLVHGSLAVTRTNAYTTVLNTSSNGGILHNNKQRNDGGDKY